MGVEVHHFSGCGSAQVYNDETLPWVYFGFADSATFQSGVFDEPACRNLYSVRRVVVGYVGKLGFERLEFCLGDDGILEKGPWAGLTCLWLSLSRRHPLL